MTSLRPRFTLFLLLSFWLLPALAACESADVPLSAAPMPSATPTPIPVIGVALATRSLATRVVVQTTVTPLPTATATVTPTPRSHTIAPGDTLLALAIQYGTTTDEIQQLNLDLDPRLLLPGQEVLLPVKAPVAQPAITGTEAPLALDVLQLEAYPAANGAVTLIGLVQNDGQQAVENVMLEVALYGNDGGILETLLVWTAVPVIQPGAQAPFAVLLTSPPGFAVPRADIVGGQAVVELGSRYLDLQVSDVDLAVTGDTVTLTGELRNTGTAIAESAIVVGTLFDADSRLIGFAQVEMSEPLAAAASLPFTMVTIPPGGTAVSATFSAHASRATDSD